MEDLFEGADSGLIVIVHLYVVVDDAFAASLGFLHRLVPRLVYDFCCPSVGNMITPPVLS